MSTKITLSHNDFIHVYNEVFNDESVFIEFNISDDRMSRITVTLDPSTAIVMYAGLHGQIENSLNHAQRTDDQIMEQVKKQVAKRTSKGGVYSIMGEIPYGLSSDSAEQQISRGFDYFKSHRDKYKDMVDKAMSLIDDKNIEETIMSINKKDANRIASKINYCFFDLLNSMSKLRNDDKSNAIKQECIVFMSDAIGDKKAKEEEIMSFAKKMMLRIGAITQDTNPNLFESGGLDDKSARID